MWMESEKHPLAREFSEYLNGIRSGGHYLNGILTNVLDVSAAEAGFLPLQPEEFYLADWTGNMRQILDPIADNRKVALAWELPDDDNLLLHTDPLRLSQILLNLAHNAIKFTANAPNPAVRIHLAHRDGFLDLNVEDNGPGLEARHLTGIFEEFQADAPSQKTPERGPGLGLTVVKINLKLLGGTVRTANRRPSGARFTAHVPLRHPSPA